MELTLRLPPNVQVAAAAPASGRRGSPRSCCCAHGIHAALSVSGTAAKAVELDRPPKRIAPLPADVDVGSPYTSPLLPRAGRTLPSPWLTRVRALDGSASGSCPISASKSLSSSSSVARRQKAAPPPCRRVGVGAGFIFVTPPPLRPRGRGVACSAGAVFLVATLRAIHARTQSTTARRGAARCAQR